MAEGVDQCQTSCLACIRLQAQFPQHHQQKSNDPHVYLWMYISTQIYLQIHTYEDFKNK